MDRPSERKKVALSTGLEEAQNGTEDSSEGGREGRRRGGGGGEGDAEVALYKWAGQAEMVRAGQKDELYTSQLQGMILESAQTLVGQQQARRWDGELRAAADVVYHGLTTLRGVQTLGEEYCDIQQVEASSETIPLAGTRTALVLWKSVVRYLASLFQARLVRTICDTGPSRLPPSLKAILLEILPQIRGAGDALLRLHQAVFYVRGRYISVPHRMTEVRHVSLGGGGGGGRTPYALLGWLILGEQAVSFCMLVCKVVGLRRRAAASGAVGSEGGGGGGQENVNEVDQGGKCMLCLETRRATTATPCGHLFCWECISEWCGSKALCPLCRQGITHTTLLRISGYIPLPEA